MNKKGNYFVLDALFASILLITAVILLINSSANENRVEQKSFISKDILNSLSEIKIYELNNSFIYNEINNGNITRLNNSIIEQIGEYWVLNKTDKARELFESVVNISFNENVGIRITIEDEEIFSNLLTTYEDVSSNSRMIAGITKGGPLAGFSSSAYLKKVHNKKTSSFAYLGGFVGQGNITFLMNDLPSDLNSSKIVDIYLEGNFSDSFYLYINDLICNSSNSSALFSPISEVTSWNISNCNESVQPGTNYFKINFTGNVSNSYVGGGLARIDYRTDDLQQNISSGFDKYFFPEIIGVANLFDSFIVPGYLQQMEAGLHFESSEKTYVTIGERIIEINSTGGDQWVFFDNDYFLNNSFDYNQLSLTTVPLRFASYNDTTSLIFTGNADVVLITDFSGSMKKAVSDWSQGNLGSTCQDAYDDPDTRRTNLAKCVDNEFVDTIMNSSGNRVWPVFIHDDSIKFYDNPEDKDAIKGYINSYSNGKGKTCLACAVNKAYDILNANSNSSRSKFIVLMTDGTPTHCADGSCYSTSTSFGSPAYCAGLCDVSGSCDSSDIPDMCTECINNPGPDTNLYYSTNRTRNDLNTTVYTVGFGPVDDCSLSTDVLNQTALLGNGTYQHSSNVTEIKNIYTNISYEILNSIQQDSQIVSFPDQIVNSKLYGDSYINLTYTPVSPNVSASTITVVFYEDLDNCTDTINIPQGIEILDAKVTSYSGIHWSDVAVINDEVAFNLSDYFVPYYRLGDPFVIQLPLANLSNGLNTIFVETGDSSDNRTGCSQFNSFVYTGAIPSVTSRTDVKEKLEGCAWTVAFEDGDLGNVNVPQDYAGGKKCSYQPGNESYDSDDTYDVAAYNLFSNLDTDDDGEVLVNINNLDLVITTTTVKDIPYLWGPSLIKVEVFQ